jgi:hypothetical protein
LYKHIDKRQKNGIQLLILFLLNYNMTENKNTFLRQIPPTEFQSLAIYFLANDFLDNNPHLTVTIQERLKAILKDDFKEQYTNFCKQVQVEQIIKMHDLLEEEFTFYSNLISQKQQFQCKSKINPYYGEDGDTDNELSSHNYYFSVTPTVYKDTSVISVVDREYPIINYSRILPESLLSDLYKNTQNSNKLTQNLSEKTTTFNDLRVYPDLQTVMKKTFDNGFVIKIRLETQHLYPQLNVQIIKPNLEYFINFLKGEAIHTILRKELSSFVSEVGESDEK